MTATITVNLMTHRESCTNQSDEADAATYDKHAVEFFVELAKLARSRGFDLAIEDRWPSLRSYDISGDSVIDVQAADWFMKSPQSGFWDWYAGRHLP